MMTRSKPRLLSIGSVSHGTMREADLIPDFLWEAERIHLTRADRAIVHQIRKRSERETYYEDASEDDCSTEDLEALFDLLDRYTPALTYFGAHPGDGSDYGVWVSEDLLDADSDADVYRSSNTPGEDPDETRKARTSHSYWLHVNDHGNATLYRRAGNRWIVEWSIV